MPMSYETQEMTEDQKEFFDRRIRMAEHEKRRTRGEILQDGLFGAGDKRENRASPNSTFKRNNKARPMLKVDRRRPDSQEIQGRPRTGRIH